MTTTRRRFSERDERGWRIPREGTIARDVYDYVSNGLTVELIAQRISRSRNYVAVVIWKFQHPAKSNSYGPQKPRPTEETKVRL